MCDVRAVQPAASGAIHVWVCLPSSLRPPVRLGHITYVSGAPGVLRERLHPPLKKVVFRVCLRETRKGWKGDDDAIAGLSVSGRGPGYRIWWNRR